MLAGGDAKGGTKLDGLEKITEQILEAAKAQANAILAEARETAQQTECQAEQVCRQMQTEAEKNAEDVRKLYENRRAAFEEREKRKTLLSVRQALISEVLAEAYEVLKTLPAEAYFSMLEAWLRRYARAEDGEIYFSEADAARLSEDFKERIFQAAREKNGSLKIMSEGRSVEDGFLLVYGGIEENCTLKAMMNEKKEDLMDVIRPLLFDDVIEV